MNLRLAKSIILLLIVAIVGCSSDPLLNIESSPTFVMFSLDGRRQATGTDESFRGYPVLGKIEFTKAEERADVIAALRDGCRESLSAMAKCFWPRHAISTVQNGETIDYVICFECHQVAIYSDSGKKVMPMKNSPQTVLDKLLQSYGIPLPPPAGTVPFPVQSGR